MSQQVGYLVDLAGIKFEEGNPNQSWIQIMPLGKYEHPEYGALDFTPEKIKAFADSVNSKVRGIDLDVDYDHKVQRSDAAGWIRQAADRGKDGLWALVDWTEEAASKIKSKAYKYFSPEFYDEWVDAKGKKHTDVLFGGGLTNRPFLKNLVPVNLSEVFENASKAESGEGGTAMNDKLKALAAKLELGDDATEDQVLDALGEFDFRAESGDDDGNEGGDDEGSEVLESVGAGQLSEADVKRLTEENPLLGAMFTHMQQQQAEIKRLTESVDRDNVEGVIKKLDEKASKSNTVIAPATKDALRKSLVALQGNKQLAEAAVAPLEAMLDAKIVELGERGGLRVLEGEGGKTASEVMDGRVKKLMEGDKLAYPEAVARVAAEDPELYNRLRSETYVKEGN